MNTFLLRKIARAKEISNKAKSNDKFLRHCQCNGELMWRNKEDEYEYLTRGNKK